MKLEELRNIHRGRRAFILGNGPSLNLTDVGLLKDDITIASNRIYLLNGFGRRYRPTYYTFEDGLMALEYHREIMALSGFTKLYAQDLSPIMRRDLNVIYYPYRRNDADPGIRFTSDFSQVVYANRSVTWTNLQLAYYLGCNPIYLIGMDNRVTTDGMKKEGSVYKVESDPNHFDPKYLPPGTVRDIASCTEYLNHLERSLRWAWSFLTNKGVQLFNATVGGALDSIPRVDYRGLF